MIRSTKTRAEKEQRTKRRNEKKRFLQQLGAYQERPRKPWKKMPDGRLICDMKTKLGRFLYEGNLRWMVLRQDNLCGLCGIFMVNPTFDHQNGRGGGKRDDRVEVNGVWQNAAVCWTCNGEKGSKRVEYLPHARGRLRASDGRDNRN